MSIFNTKNNDKIFNDAVNFLVKNQGKRIEIKVINDKRSIPQNAYLHLIFEWIGSNIGYTKNETKEVYAKKFLYYEKGGYTFTKSTTTLDKKEMTNYIEKIRRHASMELGIYIPAPDEREKLDILINEVEKMQKWT